MPDTLFSQNINEIKKFIKKNKKIIIKPIHSYSGNDIHLLNKFNSKLINKFIKKHDHIMCQKFLSKINKGDKRVFIINGKVCGAISRVPKKGSFLSNMSKGAKPININLTKLENKISKLIAKDLKKENIFFAGIDFIDQKLNGDINVSSLLAFVAVMFITPDSLFIRLSNIDTWSLVFYRGIIPFFTCFFGMLIIYKLNFLKFFLIVVIMDYLYIYLFN